MSPNRSTLGNIPQLHSTYVVELREHALALIHLGYQRMNSVDFAVSDEDEITGELARQMDDVLQDENAPSWAEYYTVKEQVRSNSAGKLGKSRPIVDVELERNKRGFRPRLRFEAKRLGRGAGVSDYVGGDGLDAFLSGYYSRTHNEVGMLGYVQAHTETYWASKLSLVLIHPEHGITLDGSWRIIPLAANEQSYRTDHTDAQNEPIAVFHVLMKFCLS